LSRLKLSRISDESSNHQFSSLQDLSFALEETETLFGDTTQEFYEFLDGPIEPYDIGGFQSISPHLPPTVAADSPFMLIIASSPSSPYCSLSPSLIESPVSLSSWSIPSSPSSDGRTSLTAPPSGLSRGESSASLRHHHSPRDPASSRRLRSPVRVAQKEEALLNRTKRKLAADIEELTPRKPAGKRRRDKLDFSLESHEVRFKEVSSVPFTPAQFLLNVWIFP
jgi:hypothetical protein